MKKVVVFLLFLVNTVIFAAVANLSVKNIEVVNNQEVPAEVVLSAMSLKEGNTFSSEAAVDDFQKIKATGYFDDIVIQPITQDGGVKVVVNVFEKADVSSLLAANGIKALQNDESVDKTTIISNINVIGNKSLSAEEVTDIVGIKKGDYLSTKKIEDAQKKLLASGYFSSVKHNVTKEKGNATVIFNVVENPIVKNIVIKGNNSISTEEIEALLSTKVGKVQNYALLNEDREKIQGAYQAKGYTLVNVADMSMSDDGTLTIQIVEGIVRKIEVKKMVTKQKGNRRQPTDDVLKTQTYVIDREIEIVPGQIFDNNAYEATVENLMRLGIFKNVKYEARTIPGDPEGIDLVLLIDEDRTAILQGAVSYGSEVGLMGTLSLKDSNWKGKGQEFGFTFEKSNKDYTGFTLEFFDPWIKNTDRVSWGWSAYKTSYGDGTSNLFYDVDTIGLRANIGKGLSKNVRLSIGGKVEYIEEKHKNGAFTKKDNGKWYYMEASTRAEKEIGGVDDKYFMWSIYPYISYDTRNNYLNPTSGEYAKFQIEAGHAGGYKGDYFGNATLELRKYHKGFFKNNTFAYKIVGGIMTDTTKESQTFWVGGGNSLRGYDGGFFKGTQKVVATIENRTQINDILGIVFFADAGRSWKQNGRDPDYTRDNKNFGENIATTAGVGLRLNTPIGPLRFDFGWPVGNKMDKDGMKFYFNMGQAF
ncbi:MAG: outer membrane protein assembly factor [Fusobacterium gastrosuis]|uniref:BamA/OMP85 family outer membrane protein n=1 Tax=Fusobacterium gastrosuis TaxID=1755100 RepID=UPI002A875934|nr:outer membrane protein assembly factor [Fusobacterium gastrosuis]